MSGKLLLIVCYLFVLSNEEFKNKVDPHLISLKNANSLMY